MTDEIFVQLFWFIFFVVAFIGLLVICGLIAQRVEFHDYYQTMKHQKARARWAEMMSNVFNREETK